MFAKILKSLFILITTQIMAQGIVGEYRLVGFTAVDYDFCRQNTDIVVTEKSGFDLSSRTIYTVQQGENIDYDVREPYPLFALNAAGVDLWVYFAEDLTATIQQGSTYPSESSGEGCFTEEIAVAIQEDFSYYVDLNSNQYIPTFDILGLDSYSPYKGFSAGSIEIFGSSVFDVVPPLPTIIEEFPFPIDTSSVFNRSNGIIPAWSTLPGTTTGYAIKSTDMYSFIDYLEYDPNGFFFNEDNPPQRPSLYLEWHAIDGPINQSGLGDLIGDDEDGDGTDYDSIYGLDQIKITKVKSSPECGANSYNIGGNHIDDLRIVKYNQCLNNGGDISTCNNAADQWIEDCIEYDQTLDNGGSLYIIDLNQDQNFNWGGYITWNSHQYTMTGDGDYLSDDSHETFNSNCLNDNDPADCSGRLIFEYAPQCIPSFNVRYFMAELQEHCQEVDKDICGVCFGHGIPEGYCDCYFGYRDCNGNCDEDPSNDDLSCFGCDEIANSMAELDENGRCVCPYEFDDCGVCGGDNSNCIDCLGVPYGDGWESDCGCVATDNSGDDCDDCAGVPNGNLINDCANICGGSTIDTDNDGICDNSGDEIDLCPNGHSDWISDSTTDYDSDGCKDNTDEDTDDDNDGLEDCWNYWDEDGVVMTAEEIENAIAAETCEDFTLSLEPQNTIPTKVSLINPYPNPFNPVTNFNIEINYLTDIEVNIYSINGNFIETLYNGSINSGIHQFSWDGTQYSSGIYIISLNYNNNFISKKVVLLK